MAFAIVYIPLTVIMNIPTSQMVMDTGVTLMMLTSIFNPVVTLYFKKQFRIHKPCGRVNLNDRELHPMGTSSTSS